jgi:hypothetical protein
MDFTPKDNEEESDDKTNDIPLTTTEYTSPKTYPN